MHPAEDGLVLPTDGGGAGGGVEEPGGDQVQRLGALAAAPVGRRHRGAAQVLEAAAPLGHIDADHRTTPGRLRVGTSAPDPIRIPPRRKLRVSTRSGFSSAPGFRWTSDWDIICLQTQEPTPMSNTPNPGERGR